MSFLSTKRECAIASLEHARPQTRKTGKDGTMQIKTLLILVATICTVFLYANEEEYHSSLAITMDRVTEVTNLLV